METFVFYPNVTKKIIAKLIIIYEYPLSCIDLEYFKTLIKSLNYMFNCMSHNIIKSDIMEMYQLKRAKVLNTFERSKSIIITIDMWIYRS